MKLQGPILVGTDFSAASDEALRQANDLANDLGTGLIVCHVVPELDTVNILFPQLAARNAEHREILTIRPWPRSSAKSRRASVTDGEGQSRRRFGNASRRVARSSRRYRVRVSSFWDRAEPRTEWYDTQLYRR